ncbi:MAG: hypothetical protein IKH11_08205 [Bacteroidales bacterium]|nr:hypothetical protein [Bacteroidales bacterium]
MDIKEQLTYKQPLVNIITIQAGYIVCNSPSQNSIDNVAEDDYGTF